MEEQTPPEFNEDEQEPIDEISWRAHEFEYHQKNALWYFLWLVVTGGLLVAAVLTKQWFSIASITAVAVAVVVFAARKPKILHYTLDEDAVTVEGKTFPLTQFESFNIVEGHKWRGVELDPVKRFSPRVSLPLEDETGNDVLDALAELLPQVTREPDLIDRWVKKIKF